MIYKDFKGLKLSHLGFGTMRLPVIDGKDKCIDKDLAEKMFAKAIEAGVNYFDTAWGYHEGNSELVTGEILSNYDRDSFYLATKFPGYDLSNMPKVEEIFERQLEKLRTDHFDFYLIHNVCEMNIDEYLNPKHGVQEYLIRQRENGRIKHLGLSSHGKASTLRRYLDIWGSEMVFCQLQVNYVDWEFQKASDGVALLKEKDIPLWVMEPVRGGLLARLSEENAARLKELRPDESPAAWAFRYLQTLPETKVILSGMTDLAQVEDNLRTFETEKPLTEREQEVLSEIASDMLSKKILPCTACRYCTGYCPQELDIPYLLSLYNDYEFTGGGYTPVMRGLALSEDKQPSACIGCASCEQVCPQQIGISGAMSDFAEKLKKGFV